MMNIPYVDIGAQTKLLKKDLLLAIEEVLDHGNFILGKEVQSFEEMFASYCGVRFAVGVNSGTDALFLSLKALGIGQGDEVITAPNSFIATASVIIAAGAKPVFVDVRNDCNINPDLIEKAITPQTSAIIPVHLTGRPADMDPIACLTPTSDENFDSNSSPFLPRVKSPDLTNSLMSSKITSKFCFGSPTSADRNCLSK